MAKENILHEGLYSTDPLEVMEFTKRVNAFNLAHIGSAVKLDIMDYPEGDRVCEKAHYKFRLLFPNKDTMRIFWAWNR